MRKSSTERCHAQPVNYRAQPSRKTARATLLIALALSLYTPLGFAENIVAEAYSSFVRSLAHSITNDYQEMMNTNLTTKQVEFNGKVITYQYLLWRLRPNSVCANYKHDLLAYSQCGKSAQQLFNQTCKYLNNHPSDHWKHQKMVRLYCAAAVDFQPVIAEAGLSKSQSSETQQKRQLCSALRMEALRTRDPLTIQKRDQACKGDKQ